jgi:hypothetical protein
MSQELLPFNKRRACKLFAKWVKLAGGKVRGWDRAEQEGKTNNTKFTALFDYFY